jgi:hypothetical protein
MNVVGFISDRFQFLNDSGNKKEANGMLSVYIEQGAWCQGKLVEGSAQDWI